MIPRRRRPLSRWLSWPVLLLGLATPALASPEAWTKAIDTMVQADAAHPPPRDAVLFVGSSSIVKWKTLAQDFPQVPVINHGFGGSELADSVFYADRIVIPAHPRLVVVYAGDNDLAAGKTPEKVAADFTAFRTKVHAALPAAHIIFLSIKESPSRLRIVPQVLRANQLIAADCATDARCRFVDVNAPMLDKNGNPRPELFVADQLHMQPAGYAIWTAVLSPLLKP